MRLAEAELQILSVWLEQPESDRCSDNPAYPMIFYNLIKNDFPHLLKFRSSALKNQLIQGWINKWQQDYCIR